jgi:hypothetical protein
MPIIDLVVGDWSDDGHGKADHFLIETACDRVAVKSFYTAGTKALDFDLGSYCQDFRDEEGIPFDIAKDAFEKLDLAFNADSIIKGGDDDFFYIGDYNESPTVYPYPDAWARIWLSIAEYGAKVTGTEFVYAYMLPDGGTIPIGGYGIYE